MEIIVISENRIKISLNAKEMKKYGVDENDFHLESIDMRSILKRILHNSDQNEGFEAISPEDKLLMQLYPEKEGGCELFVTRLDIFSEEDDMLMPREVNDRFLQPKSVEKSEIKRKRTLCYAMDELAFVLDAAAELKKRGFAGKSDLFKEENGRYFIFLHLNQTEGSGITEKQKSAPISFLSEFGALENSEYESLRLLERGICIFKGNALESLFELIE